MRLIVQKFGGTSVASPERRRQAAQWVRRAKDSGYSPVVVVSAMGRAGEPYATDTLIRLASEENPDITPREIDLLASCGEIISSTIMVGALREQGLDPVALTGGQAGIITDDNFNDARILRVEPERLLSLLGQGKVPVVAGFQGVTGAGEITTLGRGGSDTTGAALGAALGAEVVEIFTDVPGVKTADPAIVPEAKVIPVMNYEEVFEMASLGARVIHPRAVEIARRSGIPLRVRSTFEDGPGTLIMDRSRVIDSWPEPRSDRVVTGITHLTGLAQVKIHTQFSAGGADMEVAIFRALAKAGISIDLISVFPEMKAFTVAEGMAALTEKILMDFGAPFEVSPGCAKVSVIGSAIADLPGVMANVVEALYEAEVSILATADSHLTISCLVRGPVVDRAVRALHDKFHLGKIQDEPRGVMQAS